MDTHVTVYEFDDLRDVLHVQHDCHRDFVADFEAVKVEISCKSRFAKRAGGLGFWSVEDIYNELRAMGWSIAEVRCDYVSI